METTTQQQAERQALMVVMSTLHGEACKLHTDENRLTLSLECSFLCGQAVFRVVAVWLRGKSRYVTEGRAFTLDGVPEWADVACYAREVAEMVRLKQAEA